MILLTVQLLLFVHVTHTQAYENLALKKPAWQAYNYPHPSKYVDWGAHKSVDGKYSNRSPGGNQCTISDPFQRTATLRVDLQRVVSISHINIYYRTDKGAYTRPRYGGFAGFFLYVSNTTSKDDGQLCFHEMQNVMGTPTENQTISCPVHGRYVIYYNERKQGVTYPTYYSPFANNDVCELEVYGCHNQGMYGEDCERACSSRCHEQKCNINTGNCLRCLPGYQGGRCNQVCNEHRYGLECTLSCGNCSDGETCYHVNGTCPNGCSEGVEGDTCQSACSPGSYGKNCIHECSENCGVPRRCNRFTGECEGGCQPGWKGILCDKECDGGMYGLNCNKSCGHCLDNAQCHHINGTCLKGCSSEYEGLSCINECGQTSWGINCEMNCSTDCVNQSCHHVSGECSISAQHLKTPMDKFKSLLVIVGVTAFVIVLAIVVFSMILRRRAKALKGNNNRQIKKSKKDQISEGNSTTGAVKKYNTYTELGALKKPNTYIELGALEKPNTYIELGALEKPNTYTELGALEKPNTYTELGALKKPNTYTELGALKKPNTYEELHPYANT